MNIEPLTDDRLPDLADLFGSNSTTNHCYCMYFLLTGRDFDAGAAGANRERFEVFAARAEPPAGLLAYRDGQPVGWCAIGPRARYPKVLRSPLWKGRDSAEDESVWLVPCFFVRRTARRSGVVRALLAAAVELASKHGAPAIEGFPRSGADRVDPASAYVGAEPVFASLGFTPTRRPNERRVVMRREL